MKNNVLATIVALVLAMAITTACGSVPGNPQAATPDPNGTTTAANTPAASSALPFAGKNQQKPPVEPITIPAGTAITVRLQTAVSSNMSNPGDKFDAVLDAPLTVAGKTLAPAGAPVTGRVVTAHRSGRLTDPGVIQLALASVTVDGKSYPVTSSSVIAKGESHKKRNWAMIGGGAGGGALLGGLLGGGKGAVIGSAVGAGAGTTTAYATGKKDVGFGTERRLTFKLKQPVVLQ